MRDSDHRIDRALPWIGFFGLVLLAWGAVFLMQVPAGTKWANICGSDSGSVGFLSLFFMWSVMSAAMMAPTFVPTLATYQNLGRAGAGSAPGFAGLVAGYLLVWGIFSGVAAFVQQALAGAGLLDDAGASLSLWLSALLLALAGGYQFSRLKDACLTQCRVPLMFFMAHWRAGPVGALHMGARLGLACLGCCWALMTLAFVGGVMNLVWMGIALVLMVLEKLPQAGRRVTRPLGTGLLVAALGLVLVARFS
ncbi:MAG: DUF2182 domain-containing protein [Paracoccaceae bacterium]